MGRDSRAWSIRLAAASLAATAIMTLATPQPSVAGQLLGTIFRFLGAAPRDDRYPLAYADPAQRPPEQAPPSLPDPLSLAPAPSGATAYCVRLCDGRYFPLSGAATAPASAAKLCSSLCPASRTAVFRGDGIEAATALNGERYAALANAYVYRDHLVAGCTCNGRDAFGLAPLDIAADPTLRPGDAVAAADGIKVFRGAPGERHRAADFTPVRRAGGLASDLRSRLAAIRVAPAR